MTRREGRAPSQRQLRVGEEIRHALAWLLERGDFHDAEMAGLHLTVTEVTVSPDLKHATVYVVPLGGGDPGPALTALGRVKAHLRREVAHRVRLKFAPDLVFEADSSFDEAAKIHKLLRQAGGDHGA